mgnify:CR=1 FL=1
MSSRRGNVIFLEDALDRAVELTRQIIEDKNPDLPDKEQIAEDVGISVNEMLAIHADDPAFGYRFMADELAATGIKVGENRVHRLAREHRIIALECSYPDEPGLLARLTGAIGAAGGNILEVIHNRLDLGRLARETSIRLIVETRDDGHTRRVIAAIEEAGLAVRLDEHIGGQY